MFNLSVLYRLWERIFGILAAMSDAEVELALRRPEAVPWKTFGVSRVEGFGYMSLTSSLKVAIR